MKRTAFLALVIVTLSACATTSPSVNETDCYDLKVRAKAIGQFPTPIPNDPNYIVISWPWFVDLEVSRVIDGRLNGRKISALAVLHSAYVDTPRTWYLRENTLGDYNVLRFSDLEKSKRCVEGEARAEPYLRPSDGKTLASLRQEAIAEWQAEMKAEEQWLRENPDFEE